MNTKNIIAYFLFGFTLACNNQANAAPNELDDLLKQVREYGALESAETKEREQRFATDRDKQISLLTEAQNTLRKESAISTNLKLQYKHNEEEITGLEKKLKDKMGNLSELVGVVRTVAGDTIGEFESSIISSQFPDRKNFIKEIAKTKTLPSIQDLENLWFNLQQEMTESGKVSSYKSEVLYPSGNILETLITRVGPFNAFTDGKYLKYIPETQQLALLDKQPSSYTLPSANDMTGSEFVTVTIDPTRGTLLDLLGEIPSLWERIQQGRFIAYIIIIIGVLGIALAIERILTLSSTQKSILNQKLSERVNTSSPLGRILDACKDCKTSNITSLEKTLDDAITKELPALEKRLSTIKILAVISPLLGLLGTVTGIIETFQSITLFGTGDPRLMASGISQALITTALGLVAAVPIILLHNMAMTKAKACAQVLEEQSAGILSGRLQWVDE